MSAYHHKYLSSPFIDIEVITGLKTVSQKVADYFAGLDAREERHPKSSHVSAPLSAYKDTINAWASIIIPADPLVSGDKAAGELAGWRWEGGTKHWDTFADQLIRWVEVGFVADLGIAITEHDAVSTFHFIDGKSVELYGVKFHEATVAQQTTIVTQLLADGYGDAVEKFSAQLTVRTTHLTYWTNFPEHRVRNNPLGLGTPDQHRVEALPKDQLEGASYKTVGGAVILTQPEWQISSPNVPGTGTAFDYVKWYYPLKKSVEDLITLAFLEAEAQPAASEAALTQLISEHNAGTLVSYSE